MTTVNVPLMVILACHDHHQLGGAKDLLVGWLPARPSCEDEIIYPIVWNSPELSAQNESAER